MKKVLLCILTSFLLFSLLGCGTKGENKQERVLKMGVVPSSNSEKLVEDLEPFAKALSQKLGVKVEVFVASSYIGVIEGIGSGSVDFGIVPPFSAILAQKQSNTKNILVGKTPNGKPGYYSEIFVRNDANISKIEDLRGKKIAFVDPSSSSGYIYPGAMLKDAGIDLEKDISYQYSGGHDKSLQLLLDKDVDAIASYENLLKKYEKEFPNAKSDIKVLAKSELIPGVTVVASGMLGSDMQNKIKEALLDIQDDTASMDILKNLYNIAGFEEVNESSYKTIEKVAAKMNIDLGKVK
ncbi:phosphate/phosphite/phosphonate ABC transporter substrate-binding protein [Gemella cuniculi]|uniref:phosphate/phosphite/phosphonate ABC transporter substrate-binding protein n=1 Tax=Gemella cuniculi TaxID=150240 RepID=UPI0004054EC6|nr:phosphate/phosphite/phosphonate ABC transporter substrate-binding protein [Gemella cuniculi]